MRAAIVIVALSLAACAPTPSVIVERPDTSPEQQNRDMAWCRNNPPSFGVGNHVANCMRAKGYTILSRV